MLRLFFVVFTPPLALSPLLVFELTTCTTCTSRSVPSGVWCGGAVCYGGGGRPPPLSRLRLPLLALLLKRALLAAAAATAANGSCSASMCSVAHPLCTLRIHHHQR